MRGQQIDAAFEPLGVLLQDRAKIGGTVLPKLPREVLANTLNACLQIFPSNALVLIRDEKVSAVHSGDEVDYSILPIDELIQTLKRNLDERFPGNVFETGYADHAMSGASWKLPGQKEDLIGTYAKTIAAMGQTKLADKLVPGVRFLTSDTGIASAKVSALLLGGQHPIHIGGCIAVDHRNGKKVSDFDAALDQLFAQFGKSMEQLQKLLTINLNYPVNAMTRVWPFLCSSPLSFRGNERPLPLFRTLYLPWNARLYRGLPYLHR